MSVRDRMAFPMIPVDDALRTVLDSVQPLPPVTVNLEEAPGLFLAEPVVASRDMPPFDRTAMDGYALRSGDTADAPVELRVVEEIPAGHAPDRPVGPGEAAKIMTGAPIPDGADAVEMVEKTEASADGTRVKILSAVPPGQHIRRAGEDIRQGGSLLNAGDRLTAAAVSLLAAEGKAKVRVIPRPQVALLSTGDELVDVSEEPADNQIRDTNSWTLLALLRKFGIQAHRLGIGPDREAELAALVKIGMQSRIFLVTGGVSMGERDLVGEQLRQSGCEPLFQRVAIQPGKPLYFGVHSRGRSLVFGLPGNPVSVLVDFKVFVEPAIRKMMGAEAGGPVPVHARLEAAVRRRRGRRGYLPAVVSSAPEGGLKVRTVDSRGSADMVALSRSNALMIAPEDEEELAAGRMMACMPLEP